MKTKHSRCWTSFPTPKKPSQRLAVEVAALYRLTDRMVQARFEASMAKIEHQEKLTRTELAAKRAEISGWPGKGSPTG